MWRSTQSYYDVLPPRPGSLYPGNSGRRGDVRDRLRECPRYKVDPGAQWIVRHGKGGKK